MVFWYHFGLFATLFGLREEDTCLCTHCQSYISSLVSGFNTFPGFGLNPKPSEDHKEATLYTKHSLGSRVTAVPSPDSAL